jgi:hypothetical protein
MAEEGERKRRANEGAYVLSILITRCLTTHFKSRVLQPSPRPFNHPHICILSLLSPHSPTTALKATLHPTTTRARDDRKETSTCRTSSYWISEDAGYGREQKGRVCVVVCADGMRRREGGEGAGWHMRVRLRGDESRRAGKRMRKGDGQRLHGQGIIQGE